MNFNPPNFETERFSVVLLSPSEVRDLAETLLQDEALAARVPWLVEKAWDDAVREAYGVKLHATYRPLKVWGVMSREFQRVVGAVIARNSPEGIDVDVLVGAPQHWDGGVSVEATRPVIEWLEDHSEVIENFPVQLH